MESYDRSHPEKTRNIDVSFRSIAAIRSSCYKEANLKLAGEELQHFHHLDYCIIAGKKVIFITFNIYVTDTRKYQMV